ncbi:MAG: hypothetical protein KME04_19100 [Pleurocapsa minor GSE-CHR-MK-17-07R]|jgi:hypothetical protein|nr:hypothetical protein [Pleurocapsa minor GSE-CHR-MK 17-07R]
MSRRLALPLGIFFAYLVIAVAVTWPLATMLDSALAGFPYGDAYETAHHMWWFGHALQTGQSPFFASNLAYPAGLDGITLWSNPLHFFPAWLMTYVMPLAVAYNLQLLLTLALNGLAAWGLARWLLRREWPNAPAALPAFFAGLVFMLFPAMQGHLGAGHAGLMVQWPLPLAAWALLRLDGHRRVRDVLLAAGLGALVNAGHPLQLLYALAPLAGVLLLAALARRAWGTAGRIGAASALAVALAVVFLIPTFSATFGSAAYADEGGSVRYSIDLLAPVTPSFFHPVASAWEYPRRVLGVNIDEGAAYLGLAAGGLALLAMLRARPSRVWAVLALLAILLALGPLLKVFDTPVSFTIDGYRSYVTLPWALAADLPGFSLARAPGRFTFVLALALSVLTSYGAGWLSVHARRVSMVALPALMLLTAFEYQTFWPLPTTTAMVPQAIADLRDRQDIRAVFDIPWGNLVTAKAGLFLQTAHEHNLIAGQVTRSTPVSPARLTLLETHLSPDLLRDVGVDVVIVHRGQDADGSLYARALDRLGAPAYEDASYAVFDVPQTSAAPRYDTVQATTQPAPAATTYVYAPYPLWVRVRATASSADVSTRAVRLLIDDTPANSASVTNETALEWFLPLTGGFHTLTVTGEPACPARVPAGQTCAVLVSPLEVAPGEDAVFTDLDFRAPGQANTDYALTLRAAFVPLLSPAGNTTLRVPLWWSFARAITQNDIRFVHVIAPDGSLAAQQDTPLADAAAGAMLADTALIDIADLPPGEYRLRVGWYTYPEIAPYCALDFGRCEGDFLDLGAVAIR